MLSRPNYLRMSRFERACLYVFTAVSAAVMLVAGR